MPWVWSPVVLVSVVLWAAVLLVLLVLLVSALQLLLVLVLVLSRSAPIGKGE